MKKIFLLVIISLSSSFLYSQNMNDAYILSETGIISNARALSMGNAYSTLGNDVTALSFNPATLGLVRGIRLSTGINFNRFVNGAEFFGSATEAGQNSTSFSQFGVAFSTASDSSRNLVFGLGYTQNSDYNRTLKFTGFNSGNNSLIQSLTNLNISAMRDLNLSEAFNDPGTGEYLYDKTVIQGRLQQSGNLVQEGSMNNWSGGFSYEFAPSIFFGAGANYKIGNSLSDYEYIEADVNNVYGMGLQTVSDNPLTADFDKFTVREVHDRLVAGWDFRMGILYKFYNFIGISFNAKIPTSVTVIDNYSYIASSKFLTGKEYTTEIPEKEYEYKIASPFEFTVGAAVNLWFITGVAEITYIDYTQMKFTDGFDLADRSLTNKQIKENYTGAFNLRGGAELRIPWTGLSARAGFILKQSPLVDATIDNAKKYLTAGVGIYSNESISFNVAYALGWWDEISNNYGTGVSVVSQKIRTDNILATFTLNF